MKSILTISRNPLLQGQRAAILRKSGYQVAEALTDEVAVAIVEQADTLGLVLLCHSVPEESRVYLAVRIKELKPQLPILMLYNGFNPTRAKVDGSLHNLEAPEVLIRTIGFITAGMMKEFPKEEGSTD